MRVDCGAPRTMSEVLELFVACLPGLERLVADEGRALGTEVLDPQVGAGGVAMRGDLRTMLALNLGLACASHVLLRIAKFRARHFGELERKATQVPGGDWLRTDVPVAVRATARRSRLHHTVGLAERVAGAIAVSSGASLEVEGEPVTVLVRMEDDLCTLSIDTSGRPLHERGWRLETAKAPLREDLAAALVRASGWDGRIPFVDPMCGSGTLAIEAAAFARGLAPGRARGFAGERLAGVAAASVAELRAAAAAGARASVGTTIHASDRDAGAAAITQRNAVRAGVAADLVVEHAALSAASGLRRGEPRGVVVCNPPFGQRLGSPAALAALWQTLGARVAALGPGWTLAVLAADRRAALRCGLPLRSAFLADHGGIKVRGLVATSTVDEQR
jgi:putative N6-adenine-specific DNA methylase